MDKSELRNRIQEVLGNSVSEEIKAALELTDNLLALRLEMATTVEGCREVFRLTQPHSYLAYAAIIKIGKLLEKEAGIPSPSLSPASQG